MALKVSIIIVTFNDLKSVLRSLKSINKINKNNIDLKTIVVDNASSKFNPNIIKKEFPFINLIKNKKNLGFGRANNIGIRVAFKNRSDYVLLLNPDTKVDIDKDFLKKLVKVGKQDKKIGIVGPCIKHKIGKMTFFDYGGKLNLITARAWHINREKYFKQKVISRDFVTAACMLVKKDVFKKGVFFDPVYFLYLEDVDYCLQARKAGFKIINASSSKIFHYGGTSINDTKKVFYSFLSSIYFTFKWTPFIFKPVSYFFNTFFYGYLLLSWSLKRWLKSFLRS